MDYKTQYTFRAALLLFFIKLSPVFAEDSNTVEFMHWWVSKGEQASINVLKQNLNQGGCRL